MLNYHIAWATADEIPHLAAHIRKADRQEVWLSHKQAPLEALEFSLKNSERAWTAFVDEAPLMMWGVSRVGSLLSMKGVPWMLAADGFNDKKVQREFLKQSRFAVDLLQRGFRRLENCVHADNKLSVRWLKWCGFTVNETEPVKVDGADFYLFWREA